MLKVRLPRILLPRIDASFEALCYIHESGWVHRDLSTGNIYWYKDGEESRGMISDFEYAKKMGQGDGAHDVRTVRVLLSLAPRFVFAELHRRREPWISWRSSSPQESFCFSRTMLRNQDVCVTSPSMTWSLSGGSRSGCC